MDIEPSYIIIGLLAIIVIVVLFIASKMKYCANPFSDAGREKQFRKQQKQYKKMMRQQIRDVDKLDYESQENRQFTNSYYQQPNIAIQQRSTRCVYPVYVDSDEEKKN